MNIKGWVVKSLILPVALVANLMLAAISVTLLTGIVAV